MLALGESDNRKNSGTKRQKGGQKRRKNENKTQKRALVLPEENDIEGEIQKVHTITEEELGKMGLIPIEYKTDDSQQITFQTITDEQGCQSVVPICMEGLQGNDKFVIITVIDPGETELAEGTILTAEQVMEDVGKVRNHKSNKKHTYYEKVEIEHPSDATVQALEESAETIAHVLKDDSSELVTIDFGGFDPSASEDGKEPSISTWIKRFNSLSLLYTESGRPYVKCPACTAMFFKTPTFERHISSHIKKEEEHYICNFCKYSTDDPNTLFTHLDQHQDQCEVCNMNLTRKNSFKKHWELSEMFMTFTVKRDRWGRFVCIYCKLGFDLLHQLQKHWFKHSCNAKKTYQCNSCSALFETSEALGNHVCLKCPVCDKVFDTVHRLRSHTRYEKHYLYCEICLYNFILAVDHEKHMTLHKKAFHPHKEYAHCLETEDSSSFQCELCGKIYFTMSSLILHIHDDHKITDTTKIIVEEDDIARISLPEDKDGTTSYDIIDSFKDDLKCEVVLQRSCEQMLEGQPDDTYEEVEGVQDNGEPVALCWARYEVHEDDSSEKNS